MKNNLLSEKLVYTGDTRTPTHLHLVRYTPDEVHEYTADSLPPIEPQFSEKGMIWLQVHGLKETETVRQVCDRNSFAAGRRCRSAWCRAPTSC